MNSPSEKFGPAMRGGFLKIGLTIQKIPNFLKSTWARLHHWINRGYEVVELRADFRARLGDGFCFDRFWAQEGEIFREIANRRTLRFEVGGRHYFLKIHAGVGWKEIFKNLIQGKWPVLGAGNEFRAINRLHELNIYTMTLAGYGRRGYNPARLESFVITEALPHSISLEDYCRDWLARPPDPILKRRLIDRIARIAKMFHEKGLNHRDFYLCHFMLRLPADSRKDFQIYLIDLHRVQIRRKTPKRWVVKDIAGLYFSAFDVGLSSRDLLRFLKSYRGKPLRSVLSTEHSFWRQVDRKARALYDQHSQ